MVMVLGSVSWCPGVGVDAEAVAHVVVIALGLLEQTRSILEEQHWTENRQQNSAEARLAVS